jgi:N-acetylated-alpha-linked acidic dipeptidase
VEAHAKQLQHAVAYFNTDVGVAGPDFTASAVPSLKAFLRQITREVPSPRGGTVYDAWLKTQQQEAQHAGSTAAALAESRIGTLGSGSDFTPFLQHLGVPSTDIGSEGPYGVYHSVFDNYNWFIRNADPTFAYEQQQARVFGLEILHMADAELLPYDYKLYGHEIAGYLYAAEQSARTKHLTVDFSAAIGAARRLAFDGERVSAMQYRGVSLLPEAEFNTDLRQAETDLLNEAGLPHRPWYKHTIYAPGEFTGYAAIVLPGVNEAIGDSDATRAQAQLNALAEALQRASTSLEAAIKAPAGPVAPQP